MSAVRINSSPFKGEVGWGMGCLVRHLYPIPTPSLPLKGREKAIYDRIAASAGMTLDH